MFLNTNLDYLRAFAVLCVLFSHLISVFYRQPSLRLDGVGRIGVLFFFVHTSLVLLQSLEKQGRRPGWVRRFYLRRAFRIYPLPIVCLLLCLILQIPGIPHGIFPPVDWKPLLIIYFLFRICSHRSIIRSWPLVDFALRSADVCFTPRSFLSTCTGIETQRLINLTGLALFALALARVNYVWPKNLPELLSFLPCFMCGVIAWQVQTLICPRLPAWTWPIALFSLSGLFVFWATPRQDMRLQWLLCLALGFLLPLFRQITHPLITYPARQIATYSYGIYLAHDPLLWWHL